jgi:DNA-binding MarR family transcriptional regulator
MAPSPDDTPELSLSLFAAARTLDDVAQQVVNQELGDVVARPALMRLLPWLEAGPARLTDLARRADVTKQAVGQALKGCEARGWVTYEADPVDGRATLVQLTPAGREAVGHGRAVLRRLEQALAEELGQQQLTVLSESLRKIVQLLSTRDPSTFTRPPSVNLKRPRK